MKKQIDPAPESIEVKYPGLGSRDKAHTTYQYSP